MLAEMCLLAGNHYVKLSRRWIARAEGDPLAFCAHSLVFRKRLTFLPAASLTATTMRRIGTNFCVRQF